ncbi:MAG: polysaccharide deacetylase family protein [Oscillospiraceae bacterium]|nr:polysaccharide deacetylase family protein [Oscillospiraceae bacterium]
MFVFSISKKKALRAGVLVLALFAIAAITIAAILTAVDISAGENRLPIYSVERADNKVGLSFNCAWGNSNTDELLEILSTAGVRATFFVTGEFCDKFPEDVRKFAAAGHEIANHSNAHPHIKGMNINSLIADTKEAERKITMLTKKQPKLYRGPYGEHDTTSVATIEGMGYKFIQWSADSIDWQGPDSETIKRRIIDKSVAGSILLFHNDLENTTQALPEILTELKKKGLEPTPVGEMIYYNDYHIDNTGKQIFSVNVYSELSSYLEPDSPDVAGDSPDATGGSPVGATLAEIPIEIPSEYDLSSLDPQLAQEILDAYQNHDFSELERLAKENAEK